MSSDLTEIFSRYGYDPDDPVRGRDIPDRLLHALIDTEVTPDGADPRKFGGRYGWSLTDGELDCLELAACGRTSAEIADELRLSIEGVKSWLNSAACKLGVRGRVTTVMTAVARRLIPRETA